MPAITADLLDECEAIWQATEQREREREMARNAAPEVRVWDGDWGLHGWLDAAYLGDFEWVDNDTGPGVTELPWDHYAAQWIWDEYGRKQRGEKINVHITVDTATGARWSGRLEHATPEEREDGTQVLVVDWLSDAETLKWYTVWSNSFLPAILQFPRWFLLAGGARWVLLTALHLQIMREQQNWWSLPDDPLSGAGWVPADVSNWSVVVKPHSFVDDLNDGILWSLLISTFGNWFDLATPILDDAEMSIVWRRYLATDDEQPIPGQTLRHGCLVIDIVDKSGYYTGTSNGGSLWDGLIRAVAQFAEGFIDVSEEEIADIDEPTYKVPGLLGTSKRTPYVVWLRGRETGIQSSKFTRTPAKGVQVVVGGHSAYGVNEAIDASIQMAGDLIAAAVFIPPVGGAIAALTAPLWTDVVLAWMAVKSTSRALSAGWSRYFEYFQDGADRAYTIQSLLVLRQGFRATRAQIVVEATVNNGAPWVLGDQGRGHVWVGDRCGFGILGDPTGRIHVDRIKRIRLRYSDTEPVEYIPTIGDGSAKKDPAQRSMEKLGAVLGAIHNLTVAA
ncbi:phage tail protein [Nocardia wallacei]|uniref:Gp37-like protein n=1 Tax=Nocardia wallacei TaxID=480035 RepID=UPI00245677AE|nr:phage tail protein [Nocardia wallacei]